MSFAEEIKNSSDIDVFLITDTDWLKTKKMNYLYYLTLFSIRKIKFVY